MEQSARTFLRRLFGRNSGDPRIGRLARSGYTTCVLSFGSALVCTPRTSAGSCPNTGGIEMTVARRGYEVLLATHSR